MPAFSFRNTKKGNVRCWFQPTFDRNKFMVIGDRKEWALYEANIKRPHIVLRKGFNLRQSFFKVSFVGYIRRTAASSKTEIDNVCTRPLYDVAVVVSG